MAKKTIRDIDVSGKRCLVRVDFNVPLERQNGAIVITDDTRIKETLPTLQALISAGAKVILCSHLGRPKGQRTPDESLAPVAPALSAALGGVPVDFANDCVGTEAEAKAAGLRNGQVLLLENTRFQPGEESNDSTLAAQLAKLADIFVNDAFGSAHRAHASTAGVAAHLPAVSGLLMEKELTYMHDELQEPQRPFVVVLGGSKVSDKIKVIDRLLEKADTILIGGGMAYTFRLALGHKVGLSLCEPDKVDTAKAAMEKAKAKGVKFLIPVDNLITDKLDFKGKTVGQTRYTEPGEDIPDGWEGVDIGPETARLFSQELKPAKTVVWNGPMGVFEIDACARGTYGIANSVAAATASGCKTIIGGGDSVKAIKKAGMSDQVTFISTGGGASLELLEGKILPGVACLADK
jgi:phosphoglycerate kinase